MFDDLPDLPNLPLFTKPRRLRAGYDTDAELFFLKNLGTRRGPRTRMVLLQLYLQAMEKRADWGKIDQARVRRYVVASLKNEEREDK